MNHEENLRCAEQSWLEPDYYREEEDDGDWAYEMMKDRELDRKIEEEYGE